LQGHRGTRGLMPENSLPAFEKALALGVTTLELDTVLTADGVVVVHHDRRLSPPRTRDGAGNWIAEEAPPAILSLTAAELAAYDIGRARPDSRYASLKQCHWEVDAAESLLRASGIPAFHTTHSSIEEIASRVLLQLGLQREMF